MITALKKIYAFSGHWKGVLKKSVVFSLLHSIFDMFQIGALFLILNGLMEGIKGQDILFAFLLLLAGVIGKIVCSYISDFSQTRVGYFMCADKRIHIGDRMKYMPMGYFNSHSLGNLTSTVTTTISDVENNAPSVLITVIHGFIHVTVITIVTFFFDWRIGLLACLGIALFLLCNSVLQKKSQEVSPKRQAAQEDLVGATLEYIQGMGIVKSFNLGGKSNQKMKQAIEESRARNTKLETVFGPYGMVQLFVLRLASVAIMFCSILFYLQGSMTLVYCLLMCVASFLIFSELEAALTYGNISWIACSLISAWSFRMFFSLRIASRTISSLVNRMPLMKKLSEQQRVRVAMILSWHCQTVMILSLARVVLLYLAAKSNVFRLRGLS